MMQAFATLALASSAAALDNGVGLTPPMGYNTWDDFRCGNVNASNIMKVADAFVKYDLKKFGYEYVNIDDCWATDRNRTTGVIVEDPKQFPDGMKAVADYVHSKGLKFGIYTDRGTGTCVGRPGSQGYEQIDAQTYASWGVDYLKEDSCNAPDDHETAFQQYGLMRDALNATGRRIFFALCGWSDWYAPKGKDLGNSWRYGYDVNNWDSAWGNSINAATKVAKYAGVGAWNDADALIGTSLTAAVYISEKQARTQFSLWAVMASPLIIGSNILHLPAFDLETYTNTEVIAVNQDSLGIQGAVIYQNCSNGPTLGTPALSKDRDSRGLQAFAVPNCLQVWTRKLEDGYALAFVNYTATPNQVAFSVDGVNGGLFPESCDESSEAQLWNVNVQDDGRATIAAYAGDNGCWEVSGCNFKDGGHVDTNYGCKSIPAVDDPDKCKHNMVWSINANGTITTPFSGKCFQTDELGGGYLASCTGAAAQQWELKGDAGKQVIASSDGQGLCISRGTPAPSPYPPQVAGELTFDVSVFGWESARVRDLWAHEDQGEQSKITVSLSGDGDSKLFKLTQAMRSLVV